MKKDDDVVEIEAKQLWDKLSELSYLTFKIQDDIRALRNTIDILFAKIEHGKGIE